MPNSAIYEYDKIHTIKDYITRDGGESYQKKFHYPASLDSKRLKEDYPDIVKDYMKNTETRVFKVN